MGYKSLVYLLTCIAISLIFSVNAVCTNPVFERLLPLGEKALGMAESTDSLERERALKSLAEFIVRGMDWSVIGNPERSYAEAVYSYSKLRYEMGKDSETEARKGMVLLALAGASAPHYEVASSNLSLLLSDAGDMRTIDIDLALDQAMEAMICDDMRSSEHTLLCMYERTRLNDKDLGKRYKVANKLGLCYLALGANDKCRDVLRRNKIEMEKGDVVDKDYIECLFLSALALGVDGQTAIKRCHLEAADAISERLNIEEEEVVKDFKRVMESRRQTEPATTRSIGERVKEIITQNDRNFWFLTDRERTQRWSLLRHEWNEMKRSVLESINGNSENDALLNIFQYEKQVMIRPASKIAKKIRVSGKKDINLKLDTLLGLRMKLGDQLCADHDSLSAKYENLQKELMHHPALDGLGESLYVPQSLKEVADKLSKEETFIDFGVIDEGDEAAYYALIVNHEKPKGELVRVCGKEELHSFLQATSDENTKKMVQKRYEDSGHTLYHLLWRPLEDTGLLKSKVLYCPSQELNSIMPDAIRSDRGYLAEDFDFHILSSLEMLEMLKYGEDFQPEDMAAFLAPAYIGDRRELVREARKFGATREEHEGYFDDDRFGFNSAWSIVESLYPVEDADNYSWLKAIADKKGVELECHTGIEASEPRIKNLSKQKKDVVHISTHAFCLPGDVDARKYPYIMSVELDLDRYDMETRTLNVMFRNGLLLSGAERHWCGRNQLYGIDDGILCGEELSAMDLHEIGLITLMACSTGAGEVDEYEGVMGLRRALKLSGCNTMITTAWNIDKDAASIYTRCFYQDLFEGKGVYQSHRNAQQEVMRYYESPYYWGPFQLID